MMSIMKVLALLGILGVVFAFKRKGIILRGVIRRAQSDPFKTFAQSDPFKTFGDLLTTAANSFSSPSRKLGKGSEYDADILKATTLLERASTTKSEPPNAVVSALLDLEKLMRAKNKADDNATSRETFAKLDGSWRLVFTTGTVDTQKKLGQINYFPIKAVQSFDTKRLAISNGIYFGDTAVVKFYGPFSFSEKSRKIEFDFDSIAIFGVKINLSKGGAAKIGQQTGLGSENNVELVKKGAQPFFNWILASENIAVARGGGGGLALWRRDIAMQQTEAVLLQ